MTPISDAETINTQPFSELINKTYTVPDTNTRYFAPLPYEGKRPPLKKSFEFGQWSMVNWHEKKRLRDEVEDDVN